MVKVQRGRKAVLFLLIFSILHVLVLESAEARRRAFGRRGRGVAVNRVGNRNRFVNDFVFANGGFNFLNLNNFSAFSNFRRNDERVNINDPFGLGRQPRDVLSSLNVDPTGALQRLAIAPNIGVDNQGRFFELNGINSFGIRQQLNYSNGQFFGGQLQSVSPETQFQMQQINRTGNFNVIPLQ